LQWLFDRRAQYNTWGLDLNSTPLIRLEFAQTVYGLAQRVDHPTKKRVSYRNVRYASGSADFRSFPNEFRISEYRGTDVVLFEVQDHPEFAAFKFQELAGRGTI